VAHDGRSHSIAFHYNILNYWIVELHQILTQHLHLILARISLANMRCIIASFARRLFVAGRRWRAPKLWPNSKGMKPSISCVNWILLNWQYRR